MSPRTERLIFATLLIVTISAFFFTSLRASRERSDVNRQHQLALVRNMRSALTTTIESQMRAVLSRDQEHFREFEAKAVKAISDYHTNATELGSINKSAQRELASVEEVFGNFESAHRQVMQLAERSTNRQAMNLALGPCIEQMQAIEKTLNVVESHQANEPASLKLQLALHQYQTLLIPHIMEPSHEAMDTIEQQLAGLDKLLVASMKELVESSKDADTEFAADLPTKVEKLQQLHRQILRLSRENTNIHAEDLTLNSQWNATQKLTAMLDTLERTLAREGHASIVPQHSSN